MDMVCIKLYLDDLEALEPYGDAERGRLFTALLEYAKTGEVSHLSGNERFIFPMMKARLDRDKEALESLTAQRSEAGKKGGLAKASKAGKTKQSQATLSKSGKYKDKDKDKDKDFPPISPQGESAGFLQFWDAYPKKQAKAVAKKAWDKLCPDEQLTERIIAVVGHHKSSEEWQRDAGRYIPYPATWLNQRRWEDKLPPAPLGPVRSYDISELEELAGMHIPEKL